MNSEITIIHEPTSKEPFVVLDKPSGLASAPLYEGDNSAYTQAASIFGDLYKVKGKKDIEHGLLHRIDTQTRGLLLIAANQEFYDYMSKVQNDGFFVKEYRADCQQCNTLSLLEGFAPCDKNYSSSELSNGIEVQSFFRPYGLKNCGVRPVTNNSGRAALKKSSPVIYNTKIKILDNHAICSIKKGYRHQVRCHLAWIGYPILGDSLYNPLYQDGQKLKFEASAFSFPDYDNGLIKTFALP